MRKLKTMLKQIVERLDQKKDVQKTSVRFCSVELYEVSDSYDSKQVLQNIKSYCESYACSYVIAYHDRDIYTEKTFDSRKRLIGDKGQPKKPHYHILIQFPYSRPRSDISIALGIEERWILKLRKESDYDNMIWYLTHEKYDESIKVHYDYHKFDTNIGDYVEYIVNLQRQRIENVNNIVNDFIEYAYSIDDMKISYQMFYKYLYDQGYCLSEIKDYYNMLKDILIEHNRNIDSPDHMQHEIDKRLMEGRIKDKKSWDNAEKMADTFGSTVIENDKNEQYVLYKKYRKDKKKK